jgi:alkanesulfonate monooxygenase SsuD/methylene tetrahydromethanopterin reductase-like flavin-dependent oxidoreductase (luciferase family)
LFGVGGGWNVEEIEAHGTVATLIKKVHEQIRIMKEIWTRSTAAYDGGIVRVPSKMVSQSRHKSCMSLCSLGAPFPGRGGDGMVWRWLLSLCERGNPDEYLARL